MTRGDHVPVETIAEHAEGLLSEFEARRVARHLLGCADCRGTAVLLESVSRILAAADPGVMPAWYVTRMHANLARLAVTEPVAPGLLLAPAAAQWVAVSSPRGTLATGARRMSTVAAAVILLVGGTAFGIRTIGDHDREVGHPNVGAGPDPVVTYAPQVFDIPDDAVADAHGYYVARGSGTMYVPAGAAEKVPGRTRLSATKVLRPDGVEIVRGADGLPRYLMPRRARKPAQRRRPGRETRTPVVTHSGAVYDEDNFAAGVMDLLARDTAPEPVTAAPASGDLKSRVLQCAARVGRRAIAGDEGFWGHRRATVVVVESDNPDQVTGYVFYGRCDRSGPVTTRESPWSQQVERPEDQTSTVASRPPDDPHAAVAGAESQK
jgi:hypothetical protein